MKSWDKGLLCFLSILVLSSSAYAQLDRTSGLLDTPTADVLPKSAIMASYSLTMPIDGENPIGPEGNFNLRYAPIDRLELALTAFTTEDYVLGFSYQLKKGSWNKWSLALGVHEIGLYEHMSPIGHDEDYGKSAWTDDDFYNDRPLDEIDEVIKPAEIASVFLMSTIPLAQFADDLPPILEKTRFHIGIGRGRYVGYDGPNENLNSDVFSDEYHPDSAIGLFGSIELNFGSFADSLIKDIILGLEFDSRDLNLGLKAKFGDFTAGLVAHKLEGFSPEEDGPYDGKTNFKFGRIGFGLGYALMPLKEPKKQQQAIWEPPPREPVAPKPPPTPEPQAEPEPEPPALPILPPVSATISLNTIYFDYDRSEIRPDQREKIAENARTLESNPDINVVIEGHCDERGTNEYNMALGQRRANSVLRYLINYGIDPSRLSNVSYGEERPVDYGHDESAWWKNRRSEFVIQD